ncbi:PAS domain-containing sensor histidine kinase [Mucilaginibacter flavidus]|uniref:PAS domain-containing sensor histidine kinase n=1 Tax=Mucilaginibacter flavidus TaxID=2949309 RepID=UPI002092547F|nr:PAS domain S-box protein [Mucilaginibacter flavidus]MCO5945294.1 PAS domain S-box protein [Mucilaginibacter flavidus]
MPPAENITNSNNYYKAIFDNSLSAVFFTIPNGTILDVNKAASDIFGYTTDEFKKIGRFGLFELADPNFLLFLQTRDRDGAAKGEAIGIRKNGERFPCEMSAVVFKDDNGEPRTCVNLIDITERRATEKEIFTRQQLLNAVVNNTNDGLAVTDKEGHFLIFNQAMIGLLGSGPVDSKTYDWSKKFNIYQQDGDSLVPNGKLPIVRALHGEKIKDEIYLIKNPEKGNIYLSISASPIKDEKGEIIGSLVVDRDITNQFLYQENLKIINDKLLASNERFNYVVKATHDAIWDMDLKTYHIQWGEGYEKVFGYKLGQMEGDYIEWKNKIHPDDVDRVVNSIQFSITNKSSQIWEEEYRYAKADGTMAYVYDRGYIIHDKDNIPLRMVGAMQDLTARKNYETERTQLIEDLIQQNKNLEQFTYIISHNLRSPVANIMGCAEMLKDEELDADDKEIAVRGLSRSITKLDDVITDLHTILQSKNELNEKKETVKLYEVFSDVKSSLNTIVTQAGATIKTTFGVTEIRSIKSFIYSIFLNLISNSIKYNRENEPLVIEISSTQNGNKLILKFKDNGLGIDLAAKGGDLFGLYKRFHSHVEGKGLGLFMVKTQIETMKGKITVKSAPGEGTEFEIELPGE